MNNKIAFYLVLTISVTFSAGLTHTHAQVQDIDRQAEIDTLLAIIADLQKQLLVLQQAGGEVDQKEIDLEWSFDRNNFNGHTDKDELDKKYSESDIVNLFLVRNDRLYEDYKYSKSIDSEDRKTWDFFKLIAGDEFIEKYIKHYATYRLEEESVLAFVVPYDTKEEPKWNIAVNLNQTDFNDKEVIKDLLVVLVHEYGHILTLNQDQMHIGVNESGCETHRSGEFFYFESREDGYCAQKNSYFEAFGLKFWDEQLIEEAFEAYYDEKTEDLYEENKDLFVTSYAASNPAEDITESFTEFILTSKPKTSEAVNDQKILFFYDYPELVTLRTNIRNKLEEYFVESN